jgi:hypothetical protein
MVNIYSTYYRIVYRGDGSLGFMPKDDCGTSAVADLEPAGHSCSASLIPVKPHRVPTVCGLIPAPKTDVCQGERSTLNLLNTVFRVFG